MTYRFFPALGLACALAVSALPAHAEDGDSSFVRQHALDLLEDALTPDQVTTLQLIAYQAAIAAACDGFVLDETRFQKVFDTLAAGDAAGLTPEQKTYRDQHLLVVYGVLLGGDLAAMSEDVSGACADAQEARTDETMTEMLVWQ